MNRKTFAITFLIAAALTGASANAAMQSLKPFRDVCPATATLASQGQWSSGVIMSFDRTEIYIYNGTPEHLRCWYKSPTGGSAFLAGHNEVRNGYKCTTSGNTFDCK